MNVVVFDFVKLWSDVSRKERIMVMIEGVLVTAELGGSREMERGALGRGEADFILLRVKDDRGLGVGLSFSAFRRVIMA